MELDETFEAVADQLQLKWSPSAARRFLEEAEAISSADRIFASGQSLVADSRTLLNSEENGNLGARFESPNPYDQVDRHIPCSATLARPETLASPNSIWACVELIGEFWPKEELHFDLGKSTFTIVEGGNPPNNALFVTLRLMDERASAIVKQWVEDGPSKGYPGFKSLEGSKPLHVVPVILRR